MGKTAVIGDIHGCAKTLKKLLNQLPSVDEIYCVGDLIDRGPSNRLTVNMVKENKIKTCLGNHEWLMLTGYKESLENHETWISNGGKATFTEFNDYEDLEKLVDYFRSFPLYFEVDDFLICHAGILEGLTLKQAIDYIDSPDTKKLMKSIIWNRKSSGLKGKFVISGHTPVKEVEIDDFHANIDTGCVYKNKLTAMILPEKKFIQVPLQDK